MLMSYWSNNTLLLYLLIICFSFILGYLSNKEKIYDKYGKKQLPFCLTIVFIILCFFKGFGCSGTDLNGGYKIYFNSATSFNAVADPTVEIGYRVLNVIIRQFTSNFQILVLIVTVLTLLPVFWFIWKYRDKVDISVLLLLYVSIFYFQSFSLMRIYLASSFGLIAFDAMISKKKIRALLFIILANLFHVSTIILFVPYFVLLFRQKNNNKVMFVTCLILVLALVALRNSFQAFFTGRYSVYSVSSGNGGLGIAQLFYISPFFFLSFWGNKYMRDKKITNIFMAYILCSFAVGTLSYFIDIFGRMQIVFLPLIYIGARYSKIFEDKYPKLKKWLLLCWVMYAMIRFFIYIYGYYSLDGIMPYQNCFGWIV